MDLITRKFYIDNSYTDKSLHHKFYSQFVNGAVKAHVKRLINGKDWKTLPLRFWDNQSEFTKQCIDKALWCKALNWDNPRSYPWSLSDNVCIMKAAAKILESEAIQ